MAKVETQTEERLEVSTVTTKRCVCPICRSRDVWKWGRPSIADRFMMRFFGRSPLTCRRCGHKFRRKVIFGQAD